MREYSKDVFDAPALTMIGVSGLMNSRECMYWQDEIAASNGDTRRLWRTLKGVLSDHGGEDVSVHTPDDFATYFKDKVESVRLSTSTTP